MDNRENFLDGKADPCAVESQQVRRGGAEAGQPDTTPIGGQQPLAREDQGKGFLARWWRRRLIQQPTALKASQGATKLASV